MYTFLMILFIILCFFLAIFVLIQQGKGDLGLGSMSGTQMLFGGSGGQNFFQRATWVMGALFMLGALGLSILKSKQQGASILDGVKASKPHAQANTYPGATQEQVAATDVPAKFATTVTPQATTDVASNIVVGQTEKTDKPA